MTSTEVIRACAKDGVQVTRARIYYAIESGHLKSPRKNSAGHFEFGLTELYAIKDLFRGTRRARYG